MFSKTLALICDIFCSFLLMDGHSKCSALVTDVTQILNVENQIFEIFPSFPPCKKFQYLVDSCSNFVLSEAELEAHRLFFDICHLKIK